LFLGIVVGLPEAEIITKIGAGFIQHSFCLQLPAIIVDTAFIKSAIPAAVQIGAAKGTLFLPAGETFELNFFFTLVANFHCRKILILQKIVNKKSGSFIARMYNKGLLN
jgi:hypothetical protein